MTTPPHGLLQGHGRDGLLAASGGSRFVRHYVFMDDEPTWYAVPGAVCFSRNSRSGHLPGHPSWTLIGDDAGVGRLLQRLAEADSTTRATFSLTVPVHLEPTLHQHFRVGAGGNWEWMWTTSSADPGPATASVERVAPSEILSIPAFLAEHSPTSTAGHGDDTQWFAIASDDGTLAAVGAYEVARGAGYLSSVAVATHLRGRGLGRLLTAYLTRHGVAEHGLSTLALFSDNDTALALYRSLGYVTEWRFASRAVMPRS